MKTLEELEAENARLMARVDLFGMTLVKWHVMLEGRVRPLYECLGLTEEEWKASGGIVGPLANAWHDFVRKVGWVR